MSEDNIAIRARHLKKSYRHYRTNMQKIQFLLLMREAGTKTDVLRDVSFDIKKGEKVGILGNQQSGKSTLMRIMAGVIRPDSGKVRVNGELTSILDLRLGFENALTGKDNYILMSSALGRSDKQIADLEDGVFRFAGLRKVKDDPIRTYKKGASARLGFATAVAAMGDVVLFDGSLSFGSKARNETCIERLKELIRGDTTFVMAVNRINDAAQLCDRGIVLHKGKVVFDGDFQEAAEFLKNNRSAEHKDVNN